MTIRPGILGAAVAAAVGLHIAAVLAVKGVPLVGTGRFAAAASEILGDAEMAHVSPRDPVRVMLGVAERGSVAAAGPKAVLDPVSVRRPPDLGAEWPDAGPRFEAARRLFIPPPELAAERTEPLRVAPPDADSPSWADREVADAAVPARVRVVMRRLPGRFMEPAPIALVAERARPGLEPKDEKLDLPEAPALPPAPPGWPDPERAITLPEVFVDVLDVGR